jgi:hypothetical protein
MELYEYNDDITIYFEDGSETVSRKDGKYIDIKHDIIFIRNNKGFVEGIPLCKVYRFIFPKGVYYENR